MGQYYIYRRNLVGIVWLTASICPQNGWHTFPQWLRLQNGEIRRSVITIMRSHKSSRLSDLAEMSTYLWFFQVSIHIGWRTSRSVRPQLCTDAWWRPMSSIGLDAIILEKKEYLLYMLLAFTVIRFKYHRKYVVRSKENFPVKLKICGRLRMKSGTKLMTHIRNIYNTTLTYRN